MRTCALAICNNMHVYRVMFYLPNARFGMVRSLPTATTNDWAGAPRRANGKCARAHLTHPTPTAFAFAFSVTEPLLPSPRRGGPPPAICRRFKKVRFNLLLLRFKTATVQSGKGMQVHRGTTTFDRHAVGTSGEWVGMSGTPWVRYMDVPNMLFPACAMNKPLGVVELER